MRGLLIRVLVNAAALWVAARVIDGITLEGGFGSTLLVALIFGVVNAFIKPIAKLISLPIRMITFGLFTLVINALLLMLTAWISAGMSVDRFWWALFGAIVISLVSWALSLFIPDQG
jgi:putative membrane protein